LRWVRNGNGFGDRDGLGTGEGDELGREKALGAIDGFGEGDRFRGGDGFEEKGVLLTYLQQYMIHNNVLPTQLYCP